MADGAKDGCGAPPPGSSLDDADCDDRDASIYPGAQETCDPLDRNCDADPTLGAVDAAVPVFADADGDGFGAGVSFDVCAAGAAGTSTLDGDCDDGDADVYPTAPEIPYDGVDQDCNAADEYDADEDGVDDAGHGGTDCDDTNPAVFPGAPEVCDGVDNDCDFLIDDDDPDQAVGGQLTWYRDADDDGYGDPAVHQLFCSEANPAGWSLLATDCSDASSAIHPGAPEWCNGIDDDCNHTIDDASAIDAFTAYFDNDGDGYGGQGLTVCLIANIDYDGDGTPDVLTIRGGDCGDNDPQTHPGATELCGDSIRQDCTTADPDDCDSDGYLAHATSNADCDDDPAKNGAAANPGSKEICDGVDNDCDGLVDSADPDVSPSTFPDWYLDVDGDRHGSPSLVASKTCEPPSNAASVADDCDDLHADVYPGAPERCDGRDNDCDSVIDENPVDAVVLYVDADHDGFGGVNGEARCPGQPGWAPISGDCNDAAAAISPAAVEVCSDGIDNDCNSLIDGLDPGVTAESLWYLDADDDGLGGTIAIDACDDPSTSTESWVSEGGDCNDADPLALGPAVWFADLDNDGYGGTRRTSVSCKPPGAWFPVADDCYDSDKDASAATVHPGADEICNLRDDDCDGYIDNHPAPGAGTHTRYPDTDGDGYGDASGTPIQACFDSNGYVADHSDCDDTQAGVHPRGQEVCNNGIDDDCDPSTHDDYCVVVQPPQCVGWQWPDNDGDGWGDLLSPPVYDCQTQLNRATAPGGCNDASSASTPTVVKVSNPSELVAAAQSGGCPVIQLNATYAGAVALTPAAGAQFTVVGDPLGNSAIQSDTTNPVVQVVNPNVHVLLSRVGLHGGTASGLLSVAAPGSSLGVYDAVVDGQDQGPGIVATVGQLDVHGVRIEHTTGGDGAALRVVAPAHLSVSDLSVSYGAGAPNAVALDINAMPRIDRVTLDHSSTFSIAGDLVPNTNTVFLTAFDVRNATSTGLLWAPVSGGNLSIARSSFVGGSGKAIQGTGGTIALDTATVVGNGAGGVGISGTINVQDSFIFDNQRVTTTASDVSSVTGSGGIKSSYVAMVGANLTGAVTTPLGPPSFVTYGPHLPLQELDLHLRVGSSGRGTTASVDDAGAYPKNDPYYADSDNDLLRDGWEQRWFNTTSGTPLDLNDLDGWDSFTEYGHGTDPTRDDTDGDGSPDDVDPDPLDSTVF